MKPVSHPEANRLVYRIRAAITGESVGLGTAKLAWQYAEAVDRANSDLQAAVAALDRDSLLDCLLVERLHPRLLEAAESLDFPMADLWKTRCETYSWRIPETIDREKTARVKSAIEAEPDLKNWLYNQYRSAVRAKDPIAAYRIIQLVAYRFPEDENAAKEFDRHAAELLAHAAKEIRNAHDELIPKEQPTEIVKRYLAIGLPLSKSSDPIVAENLAAEAAKRESSVSEQVESVYQQAATMGDTQDWMQIEKLYLACDYRLATRNLRGDIDPALRNEFEQVATKLSRLRRNFESVISIRIAIAALLAQADGPVQRGSNGKPLSFQNRLEKLRSLEKQMLQTAGQIPQDLQQELKNAYAYANRKRLPRRAIFAAGGVIVVGAGLWLYNVQQSESENQRRADKALAVLQLAERSGEAEKARAALQSHQQTIAQAPETSPLAGQAELLEDWLESQKRLESVYSDKVAQLESLLEAPAPQENQAAIDGLISTIQITRRDLSSDLGQTLDDRFATLRNRWQEALAAEKRERAETLARYERELRIALDSANKAKSRSEFQRLQQAAQTRIQSISALVASSTATEAEQKLATLVQLADQQLAEVATKWGALDAERAQLDDAENLEEYLTRLESIHSFDTLPPEEKSAIGLTLRLKPAFASLKSSLLIPDGSAAANAFRPSSDYRSTPVTLSPEETAFLERLSQIKVFENVYTSEVRYFEGDAEAQSEFVTFLAEPVSKSDARENPSHIAFSFSVHGFDEAGDPEPNAREIEFISRADGSFWGFFYKPSVLSPESEYFGKSIRNALAQVRSSGDRMAIVNLIADLETQSKLSPAFRIYWQQRLMEFMQLDPWKWGLALSPTLKTRAAAVAKIADGHIPAQLWRSTIEQTVPSPEFTALLSSPVSATARKEIDTLVDLYESALAGSFSFAGSISAQGEFSPQDRLDDGEPLWTINRLTGRVEAMSDTIQLTPFAPVLRYRLPSGESLRSIVERLSSSSGLNLAEAPYAALLPPILQP